MSTTNRKCKFLTLIICMTLVLCIMPVEVIMAAEQTSEVIAEMEKESEEQNTDKKTSEQKAKTAEESKMSKTDKTDDKEELHLSAGAAVLLDADITMEDKELVELVKSNTTEAIEVKTLEKATSDIVMANVNEYVNVRAEATQDSEKVGQFYKDCGGHIIERKDGWTKMQSGNVTGWVRDDFLTFGDEAQALAKEVGMLTATATTQSLRVRKEKSLDASILGMLSLNETMEAISEEGDWVSVSYEGTTAYVSAEYVKVNFELDSAESMEEIRAREAKEAEAKRAAKAEAEAQMAAKAQQNEQKAIELTQNAQMVASAPELNILAALIQCEAGGEPYEGQVAVGAVVLNRVRCGGYPNTISEVIYASGQFSPATSGKMTGLIVNGNIKASCIQAAQEALNGVSTVGNAMHFRRVGSKQGTIIGNHVFW